MANGRKNFGPSIMSRPPVPRALTADSATSATNATNATNAVKVSTEATKVLLEDDDLIALVTDDGGIQPVTIANFLAFLESRYVLTPIP